MRYLSIILGALLILAVSCTPPVNLTTPVVQYVALSGGDTLQLTWTAVTGATGYNIYVDGTKNQVTAGSYSYNVASPTKEIQVSAYDASNNESGMWDLKTLIIKTSSIIVYNVADAGNINHAFYFNSSGTAIPIPLSQATDIDFVADTTGTSTELRSPDAYTVPYNSKDNALAVATVTDFDQFKDAPAPGVYQTARALTTNGLYACWIDLTNNGWSIDDHFGKIKIENISGTAVTFTTGYQPIGGLRWLISQ